MNNYKYLKGRLGIIIIGFLVLNGLVLYYGAETGSAALVVGVAISFCICILVVFRIDTELSESKRKYRELESDLYNRELLFSLAIHDLKGPAQGLLLISRLIEKEHIRPIEYKEMNQRIYSLIHKHFQLVDKMMEWMKLQATYLDVPVQCNPMAVSEDIIRRYCNEYETKKISVDNQIAPILDVKVSKAVMEVVLDNIIHNAIKYTDNGGRIMVYAEKSEKFLHISVGDTGMGMDKEKAESLFFPGLRRGTRGTMNEEGSGIGLILCHELIRRVGGFIKVESIPGKGSTFTFSLPFRPVADLPEKTRQKSASLV